MNHAVRHYQCLYNAVPLHKKRSQGDLVARSGAAYGRIIQFRGERIFFSSGGNAWH